jgi:hypothetical protein
MGKSRFRETQIAVILKRAMPGRRRLWIGIDGLSQFD